MRRLQERKAEGQEKLEEQEQVSQEGGLTLYHHGDEEHCNGKTGC